jgi:hypothetical protein
VGTGFGKAIGRPVLVQRVDARSRAVSLTDLGLVETAREFGTLESTG